jgi:SAM-dependent methyltransferase
MPDVYATITTTDRETQERLADVIEARAADPQLHAMLRSYLGEIDLPENASVLEIGCGTGAVTRILARWPRVARVLGVDPSTAFLARARALAREIDNASFVEGDGRGLRSADESFDAVVIHAVLSHVPLPERVLGEAFRVLKPGGALAVFDGDYATATVAIGPRDPLETCVEAFRDSFVHDSLLVRRLPRLLREAGFEFRPMRSHGSMETSEGGYMLTWIDRGADALARDGRISPEAAQAYKIEARRRTGAGDWFAHLAFASVIARKPGVR